MHIAICDDNIADRKQLERLLGRESDRRKASSGVFFCDSYGNSEHLSRNPMPYELFFLDMTTGETDGLAFAMELRRLGVTAPIVLCSSQIDYEAAFHNLPKEQQPEQLLFLSKPIRVNELTGIIDAAIRLGADRPQTIELRGDKDTWYVFEDDILYAAASSRNIHSYIDVHLADGRTLTILDNILNFSSILQSYTHFFMLSERYLVNLAHIEKISPFRICLKNGKKIPCGPLVQPFIRIALRSLK